VAVYKQEHRLLKIKTTLGVTKLMLEKFSGTEELSTPFEFRVRLLSEDAAVDLKSLLRTAATVSITLADGTTRPFHALFKSLTQAQQGSEEESGGKGKGRGARDLIVYEGILVPKLWFLSLKSDCRIFQNMSVPDIVEKVLKEAGITDYEFRTQGTYTAREYCVQYRETSLNFISRLLEFEGIFYFFEHTDAKHMLIFADKSSVQAPCPGQATATYAHSDSGWVEGDLDGIIDISRLEQAYTGQSMLQDYDFEKPNVNLKASEPGSNEEAYDYPGKYTEVSDGERYARIRLEEHEVEQFILSGTSRCRAFRPGYTFKLKEHFRSDTNQDYFLVSVEHDAVDSTYFHGASAAQHYGNIFKAIPKSVPFRPAQRAIKPMVRGPQTALVVGKAGEEIWVDKYGRVKVQFYWDRLGKKNEESSCWIRVSQIWAGKNWGWVTLPRIGQEVVVDFLEGDPDRPLITGRVYNADQTTPYTLPANQTQSGIKSRSSKQGGTENYNEIRFEDLKGSEMITVHAEKDMETTVEHDDTQTIQNNRTITVDGTHTETIKKDTTITITEGNLSLTLNQGNQSTKLDKGNQSTTLSMGNRSIKLNMGNETTNIDLGKSTTEAMQSIELKVGGSSIVINQIGITLKATMITLEANAITQVKGNALLVLKGGLTLIN
jgi:type VI secretion system secreted protein VgrG